MEAWAPQTWGHVGAGGRAGLPSASVLGSVVRGGVREKQDLPVVSEKLTSEGKLGPRSGPWSSEDLGQLGVFTMRL